MLIPVISAGSLAVLRSSITKSQQNFELLRGLPSVWISSINGRIFCGTSTWCWFLTKERSFCFFFSPITAKLSASIRFLRGRKSGHILWNSTPMLASWYEYISSSEFSKSTTSKSIEEESSLTLDSISCS